MAAASLFLCQNVVKTTRRSSLCCGKGKVPEDLLHSWKVTQCFSLCCSFKSGRRTMLFQNLQKVKQDAKDGYLSSALSGISQINQKCQNSYMLATGCNERKNKRITTSSASRTGDGIDPHKLATSLSSLENYFDKLSTGTQTREITSRASKKDEFEESPMKLSIPKRGFNEKAAGMGNIFGNVMPLESTNDEIAPLISSKENFQGLQPYNEAPDLYLISLLASIDIAVFLFEIASPVRSSDIEHLSIPVIYGAKINDLILDGEWWRIVTPMFLHSGFLHVVLSCWVLLTFGPRVCRGYGPFTFFLVYVLGGICANLTSFIHTPELTVCGTGPVFATIGAWLVYQVQNPEAMAEKVAEDMLWKAVIATSFSFVISNFEPSDEWSHLGAVFSGIIYGYLTYSTALLDKAPSDSSQKGGLAMCRQQADRCKSAAIFTLFVFCLCSLVFVLKPGVEAIELEDLL